MKMFIRILCAITLFSHSGNAQTPHEGIKNLPAALQKAEKELGFPILFPSSIPATENNLYAYADVTNAGSVIISIDSTENCHGAKFCSNGAVSIKKAGTPEIREDRSGKTITEVVPLQGNIKGYYTPGHAKADYWPTSLQWIYQGALYDLSWSATDRKGIIDMANSALKTPSQE